MPIESSKDTTNSSERIRKCILAGYFPNVAKMQPDGTYRLVKGDLVYTSLRSCSYISNCMYILAPSCSIVKPHGSCSMRVLV